MRITVESSDLAQTRADLLAVPLLQAEDAQARLPRRVSALDRALGGQIAALLARGDFRGKRGETLMLFPGDALAAPRVLLVGLGAAEQLELDGLRRAAGAAVGQASRGKGGRVAIHLPAHRRLRAAEAAQAAAEGAVLAGYRFDAYRSQPEDPPADVRSVALLPERAGDARALRAAARVGLYTAESENVARQLSNEPGNAMRPVDLARAATRVARQVGLRCRVFEVPELKRRKMGALLAVGQGSANPPRLIVLEHNATPRARAAQRSKARASRPATLCLVGKGITFDSGGISIKPSANMDEMKHDMSGAAAVIGTLRAAALLKLPLHVVGVVAAAENLPSATAYRPGDIITAMSGKTIEVLNTDAEGRVVLADALHYAATEFAPQAIIDLATLTGACVVSLGKWASGLFGNDEELIERIRRAGEATHQRTWPMPLWDGHKEHIRSAVADLKNAAGREAGASTAAAFLAHFVGDTPWAHLDIAGTAWTSKTGPYQPRGATGVGVRLLTELLRNWRSDGAD